jgi:hypothetical protein
MKLVVKEDTTTRTNKPYFIIDADAKFAPGMTGMGSSMTYLQICTFVAECRRLGIVIQDGGICPR